MIYTNIKNYPEYVEQWLKTDDYDYQPNTFSSTTLMQPARAYALKKQYFDVLELDINDLIASKFGTAIHDSVEKIQLKNCLQEIRLKTFLDKYVITGKFDILRNNLDGTFSLIDIKSTSVWTYIYNSKIKDWVIQLSVYRYLGRRNGFNIKEEAEIMLVFTDWQKSKSTEKDYPESRITIKKIKLLSDSEIENYIINRANILEETSKLDQKEMPYCNSEELWQSETTYAIIKTGLKRALKVCNSLEEANNYILSENLNDNYKIETRLGKVKRCNYCLAKKICTQYNELKIANAIEE